MLTFMRGATGNLASQARCVGVFIFDDDEPEQRETLSFFLRSPDNNHVRIMSGRGRKVVHIVDNDGTYNKKFFGMCFCGWISYSIATPHNQLSIINKTVFINFITSQMCITCFV